MLRSLDAFAAFVRTDPLCRRLADLGEAADTPLVLVGGCVRDWLLDRPALDWDLIVPGDPSALLAKVRGALGRHAVTLDEGFGVYRLALPDGPSLDFTRMQGNSVAEDLMRRDLTINSLACALSDGELLDPTGGYADLSARRIRVVRRENLVDDPLRMLRVYRFAATLPGSVADETAAWVRELAPAIARSAGERIWAELGKLLSSGPAAEMVAAMHATGLLGHAFPQAVPEAAAHAAALARGLEIVGTLGDAGRRAVRDLETPLTGDRPRLAVLYALAIAGGERARLEAAAAHLHWSKREVVWARRIAETMSAFSALSAASDPRRERFRLIKTGQDAVPGLVALALSWEPQAAEQASELLGDYWARVDNPPPKLVDGHDLMKVIGIPAGPALAKALSALEEAQALGEVSSRDEGLAWIRTHRE